MRLFDPNSRNEEENFYVKKEGREKKIFIRRKKKELQSEVKRLLKVGEICSRKLINSQENYQEKVIKKGALRKACSEFSSRVRH